LRAGHCQCASWLLPAPVRVKLVCLHQAAFLQYRLPAVACAPPLLLRLAVRGAPRAVMLEAQLAAAHNLPGALQGLVLDLDAPAALGELAKARPCATRYQALLLRSCRRGFGGRGLGLLEARPAAMPPLQGVVSAPCCTRLPAAVQTWA